MVGLEISESICKVISVLEDKKPYGYSNIGRMSGVSIGYARSVVLGLEQKSLVVRRINKMTGVQLGFVLTKKGLDTKLLVLKLMKKMMWNI